MARGSVRYSGDRWSLLQRSVTPVTSSVPSGDSSPLFPHVRWRHFPSIRSFSFSLFRRFKTNLCVCSRRDEMQKDEAKETFHYPKRLWLQKVYILNFARGRERETAHQVKERKTTASWRLLQMTDRYLTKTRRHHVLAASSLVAFIIFYFRKILRKQRGSRTKKASVKGKGNTAPGGIETRLCEKVPRSETQSG